MVSPSSPVSPSGSFGSTARRPSTATVRGGGANNTTPKGGQASNGNPFDALQELETIPDFSDLGLLPYLAGVSHPAFILPSPRLSSSSKPSLLAVWTNDAAAELGQDLSAILPIRDSERIKALIASQDQLDEEQWATDQAADKGETTSLASFSSLDRTLLNVIDVEISLPRWSKRRPYQATLQPSAHPSFFVLFLAPRAPVRYRPRPFGNDARSQADSVDGSDQHASPSVGFGGIPMSEVTEGPEAFELPAGSATDALIPDELKEKVEWTSLRDQGPNKGPIDAGEYRWSQTEAHAAIDWAKTPIGLPKHWPPTLTTLLKTSEMLPDMTAIWWYLGDKIDDWLIVHNSAYEERLRNPSGPQYGRLTSDAWAGEHWPTLKRRAHHCMNTGKGVHVDDDAFFVRSVETYWSWRWSPMFGPKGEKLGIFVTCLVDTEKVLARRYLETSRMLGQSLMTSRTPTEMTEALLKALELNERDFPWACWYSLKTETATGQRCDLTSEGTINLAGTVGLPFDHPVCPRQAILDLTSSPMLASATHQWPLAAAVQKAFHSDSPVYLPDLVVDIPNSQRAWGDVPYSALVLKVSNIDEPSGRVSFLIVGMNPRRPFDEQYSDFLKDIQGALLLTSRNISFMEDEKRKRSQLASLDRAKTAFFASCSHELRTPLQLIVGPLTDLEGTETSTSRKSMFSLIQRNANRLQRLVESILDFSKIESGQFHGRFTPTRLGAYSSEVAEVFRSSIEKAKLSYKVETVGDAERLLYVDHSAWEKLAYNLIGNAFKYTLKGTITISSIYHPTEFEFKVTDTGVGIPKSEISHVTERFHRVQSVSRSFEGTGIGLALCAELVQVLGGRLEIESSTAAESPTGESGSTFSVFLKYGRGHLPEGMVDESDGADTGTFICSTYSKGLIEEAGRWTMAAGSSVGGSIRTGGSTGARSTTTQSDSGVSTSDSSKVDLTTLFWEKSNVILLVDDSADMLQYLYGVLSAHCQVLTAADGNAALRIIERQRVDLVVSDIQMPTLDGYGLLAGIRAQQDPDRAITPVILISARAGEEERVGALLASADDVLPKPFSAKELIARCHLQMQMGKKRLELERNFRYESATTKLLSDLSPVGISRWRTDGTITYANDSWYQQSGHPRDKPLSEWMDSIHPDHKQVLGQMYADLFEGRQQVTGEWLWTSGRWSYCQAVIVSSHENDNYNGTICVLTDITERKRYDAERKLAVEAEEAHLRQRAEAAEQRKREADEQKRHQEFLVSVVSHEVRNPVSAILQCAGLCRSNLAFFKNELHEALTSSTPFQPTSELVNLLEEDIEALDNVTETALLIERIANDFLSLGKIQLATLDIFATPCDLSAEVRKLLGVFASEARLKGIRISLDLRGQLGEPDGHHVFLTDPVRLGQVVINLLSNAIRFTSASEQREITVALEVSASPPADDSCLPPPSSVAFQPGQTAYIYGAVTDSGPGLAPEELSNLFLRFSQANSSTHTVFGGSGLGLYVCRLITGLMGGKIEVDSVKGAGSTFRFFIATQTPDDKGDIGKIVEVKPILIEFPHVLVVEDNMINSRVIQRQLKKAGMTCETAFDGQQGLDAVVKSFQAGQRRFNCVLMDCEMPVMSGPQAVQEIRRLEAAGTLPSRSTIFALTGNARQGQIDDAMEAGMDDVIIKPYRIDQLLEKLRTQSEVI